MASTLSTLVLLAAVTATGGHRPGSAQFQVSVRVVAPMRARAPATVLLARNAAVTVGSSDARWVVRLDPGADLRGGDPTVLVAEPGGSLRPCGDVVKRECEVSVAEDRALVLVFVPDGAPSAVVER